MLLLQLLRLAWPTPEVGIGFAIGLLFALINFREDNPAPRRKRV